MSRWLTARQTLLSSCVTENTLALLYIYRMTFLFSHQRNRDYLKIPNHMRSQHNSSQIYVDVCLL